MAWQVLFFFLLPVAHRKARDVLYFVVNSLHGVGPIFIGTTRTHNHQQSPSPTRGDHTPAEPQPARDALKHKQKRLYTSRSGKVAKFGGTFQLGLSFPRLTTLHRVSPPFPTPTTPPSVSMLMASKPAGNLQTHCRGTGTDGRGPRYQTTAERPESPSRYTHTHTSNVWWSNRRRKASRIVRWRLRVWASSLAR